MHECTQRILRARGQRLRTEFTEHGVPHRCVFASRALPQQVERAIADAARRRVDRTLERGVVVAVRGQTQVCKCVLYFGAIEIAQTAVDAIRDLVLDQLFLEIARLRIRAIQDRGVGWLRALAQVLANALDHIARLVLLVVRGVKLDRGARIAVGPELLAEPVRVVRDHRVRGGEDGAGRAIVLFEADGFCARKIAQEMLHVLDFRAAPAIDRLVVVANHEHVAGCSSRRSCASCARGTGTSLSGEYTNPRVLQRVGVLKLVDQQMPETFAVMREQRVVVQPQLVRAQQQFREIHESRALACRFVRAVHVDQHAVGQVVARIQRIGAFALIFRAVDEPGRLSRREARLVEPEALDCAFDQALLVVGVEDLERLRQLRLAPMPAQQTMRDTVKRADREPARAALDQRFGAATHLAGGLVRERDREHRPRRHTLDLQQPTDAVGEHACLAGAGAGKHEVVPGWRGHRLALRRIEFVEKMGNIHAVIVAAIIAQPCVRRVPSRRHTSGASTSGASRCDTCKADDLLADRNRECGRDALDAFELPPEPQRGTLAAQRHAWLRDTSRRSQLCTEPQHVGGIARARLDPLYVQSRVSQCLPQARRCVELQMPRWLKTTPVAQEPPMRERVHVWRNHQEAASRFQNPRALGEMALRFDQMFDNMDQGDRVEMGVRPAH